MRISHSHKFIFLANARTGSTTVRNILDKYSEIKSVHITEISDDFPFYNHISALELKTIFIEREWDWESYEKFCFVRNPFDRTVSLYHHHLRMKERIKNKRFKNNILKKYRRDKHGLDNPGPSFRDFVMSMKAKKGLHASLNSFVCDLDGKLLVNQILKFENIADELPKYLKKLDISITSEDIPHLNSSDNRVKYRSYYDNELIARVRKLYQYEFDNFSYSF